MTLHVRMVSPPDLTELLVDALMAASDVSNLVVLTGSARRPDGDAVHFDAEARASALIGVFISVTTIPAASDIALSTAYANWTEAWGSTLQLLLNVAVLITIGALGLRLQRIMWRPRTRAGQPEARSPLSASGPSAGDSG